jgi:hypothetical protein
MTARATKPRLVIPTEGRKPGITPDYARGLLRGAIRVRRDQADECRRIACDAALRGDDGTAFKLHVEADLAEAEIQRMTVQIGEIR